MAVRSDTCTEVQPLQGREAVSKLMEVGTAKPRIGTRANQVLCATCNCKLFSPHITLYQCAALYVHKLTGPLTTEDAGWSKEAPRPRRDGRLCCRSSPPSGPCQPSPQGPSTCPAVCARCSLVLRVSEQAARGSMHARTHAMHDTVTRIICTTYVCIAPRNPHCAVRASTLGATAQLCASEAVRARDRWP